MSPDWRTNNLMVAGICAVGALALAGVLLFDDDPSLADAAAAIAAVSALGAGVIWSLRRSARREAMGVALDADGVRSLDPEQPQLRVGWNEVQTLRDRSLVGQVDVEGLGGAQRIPLSYFLEDFEACLDAVVRHTPRANPALPLPATFRAGSSWQLLLILGMAIGLGGGGALLGWALDQRVMALCGVATLVGLGGLAGVLPRRLELDADGLRTHAPLRRSQRPLSDVIGVELSLREGGNNQKTLDVRIQRGDGTPESVLPAGCDPIAVYRTLRAALGAD